MKIRGSCKTKQEVKTEVSEEAQRGRTSARGRANCGQGRDRSPPIHTDYKNAEDFMEDKHKHSGALEKSTTRHHPEKTVVGLEGYGLNIVARKPSANE